MKGENIAMAKETENKIKGVPVKVEEIKKLFKVNKISMAAYSKVIGKDPNYMSARLYYGLLDESVLENICTLFGVNKDDYIEKEPPKKEEKKADETTVPSVDLTEITKKIEAIDDLQIELLAQLKILSKYTVDMSMFHADMLKAVNTLTALIKEFKNEVHNDQTRLFNHTRVNQGIINGTTKNV